MNAAFRQGWVIFFWKHRVWIWNVDNFVWIDPSTFLSKLGWHSFRSLRRRIQLVNFTWITGMQSVTFWFLLVWGVLLILVNPCVYNFSRIFLVLQHMLLCCSFYSLFRSIPCSLTLTFDNSRIDCILKGMILNWSLFDNFRVLTHLGHLWLLLFSITNNLLSFAL